MRLTVASLTIEQINQDRESFLEAIRKNVEPDLNKIVKRQVKAISNLKIDRITVWDSANGEARGSSTSNFISSLIKSVPPLQDIASMAGVELPAYLGKMVEGETPHRPAAAPDAIPVKGPKRP